MKTLVKLFISLLFTYLLLELGCYILMKTKYKFVHFPTFRSPEPDEFVRPNAEISPIWGMWHYPNLKMRRKFECLDYMFHSNSVGARDVERSLTGDSNRILFLGDSFIEGWGMNEPDRLSNLLEKGLGREVLNFGCAGFTPTQEYLNYKYLAKQYDHNTIVWALLPYNDFYADDTTFQEPDKYIHYQPFFQGTDPDYHLVYKEDSLSKSTFNRENFHKLPKMKGKEKFISLLREYTFWANIYLDVKTRYAASKRPQPNPSFYYDQTIPEMKKLFFIIRKMKEEAPGKRMIILTLPVKVDLVRSGNDPVPPLTATLDSFCRTMNIEYVDMLTALRKREKNYASMYFICDQHWNEYANKLAADILMPILKNR